MGNSSKHVALILPNSDKNNVRFKISNANWNTVCMVRANDLTGKIWMHVGYGETFLPKGFNYYGKILDKDTMLERRFYCELVDQPICGTIEE